MSVSQGTVIKLENVEPGVTRIIPVQQKGSAIGSALFILFGTIFAIAAVPILGPETIIGTIAAESTALAGDIGFQALGAEVGGSEFDPFTAGFSLLGGAGAAFSSVKAAGVLAKTEKAVAEVAQAAAQDGLNSLGRQVLVDNFEKVVTEKLSASTVSTQLVRAGLTDEQVTKQLKQLSDIAKNNRLDLGRFDSELAFINQETKIFKDLGGVAEQYGFTLDQVFETLKGSGIDVVGIETTDQLAKTIKQTESAVAELKESEIFEKLEGALERDLEPTFFTRVLNAKNAESAITKVNKVLSLTNPDTLVAELANKIFDPLKSKIESKVIDPLKKKTTQKLKHLLRQDLVRKKETQNGVYPCFASSFINYIRAVPLGNGEYKAIVVFRKWGYKTVTITPILNLEFIIGWSESSSPGRIYHKFRREFGGPKGVTAGSDNLGFAANTAEIFNLLGWIPDKYISLGVSLVGNIAVARSVISLNSWTDAFNQPDKLLKQPLEDKILELGGGQFAKTTRDQLSGNHQAVEQYFQGKIQESVDQREGAFRAQAKAGRGKLDAVRGIGGIIK